MSTWTAYCSDEDILVAVPNAFATLCPRAQGVARAADGTLAGWVLSGATDYQAAGVAPGMVVQFLRSLGQTDLNSPLDLLVVDAVSGTTLTLRRPEQDATGLGQPPLAGVPGPPANGAVPHVIATMAPQIRFASRDLERRFGIDDAVPGRRPADLKDLLDLRDAAVYTVLKALYRGQSTQPNDQYDRQAAAFGQLLDDLLARLNVRWAAPAVGDPGPTNRFGTRLSR